MSSGQDRWVRAAAVVAESAWLYAMMGVLALWQGQDGSPLSWPAVLAIMGLSLVLGRVAPAYVVAIEAVYLYRLLVGAAVVYLTVSTQVTSGFDIGWLFRLGSESVPPGFTYRAAVGSLMGVGLWWRGGRLSGVEYPVESLAFSFRLGIMTLAIAAIVDIVNPADLNTLPMVLIFFAAALGGLGMGYLLPESQEAARARTWPKVIVGVVSAVLALGLVISLLLGGVSSHLSVIMRAAYNGVLFVLIWGVVVPIAFVFNVVIEAAVWSFAWLFRLLFGEAQEVVTLTPSPMPLVTSTPSTLLEGIEKQGEPHIVIQIIGWLLVAAFVLLLFYLLAKGVQRLPGRRPRHVQGHRESIKGNADVAVDLAKLLRNFVPGWLRRRRGRPAFALPEGPRGVVEVLRIYYQLLTAAEERGVGRRSHETVSEFEKRLRDVFPQDLVNMVTKAFDRAFYGHYPASEEQISRLRTSLGELMAR